MFSHTCKQILTETSIRGLTRRCEKFARNSSNFTIKLWGRMSVSHGAGCSVVDAVFWFLRSRT